MATNTRQQSKKGKAKAGSSIGPDDSASQVPFNRQSNSTNSSRESLVGSDQYENWTNAKPYCCDPTHMDTGTLAPMAGGIAYSFCMSLVCCLWPASFVSWLLR